MPETYPIKASRQPRLRCACGRFAVWRVRIQQFTADLTIPYRTSLYLCEACWVLEKAMWDRPPAAQRIRRS